MKDFDESFAQKILISLNEDSGLFSQFGFAKEGEEPVILGRGGFSTVYEMYNRERPQLKYALKVIGFEHQTADTKVFDDTNRLWWLLSSESDHIVRILETKDIFVSLNEDNTISGYTEAGDEKELSGLHLQFVLMEQLESVIVKDRFRNVSLKRADLTKEDEIISFALEIGQALLISHTYNVLHRDVKLENIFWDESEKIYKLGDFGMAKYAIDGSAETVIYTDGYGAPEIERRLYDSYDVTADIYSFGITLYLLLNDLKFPGSEGYYPNVGSQYDPGFVFPAPSHASEGMTRLIRRMCSYEPKERFQSVADVLDALKSIVNEDNTPVREELMQMADMATMTYRETERVSVEDLLGETSSKRKTRARKKEKQEDLDFVYNASVGWNFITGIVLLLLLFKGGVPGSPLSSDILFWTVTAAVIFEALLQKIGDLEVIFGIFTLAFVAVSAYTTGFSLIHLIFIICILSGCSVFSLLAGVSTIIWILLELTGKLVFLNWFAKHDLGWIFLGLFLIKLLCFTYIKSECGRSSPARSDIDEIFRHVFFPGMIIIGIICLILKKTGLVLMPEIIVKMHFIRTGIFGLIGLAIVTTISKGIVSDEDIYERSLEA